MTPGSVAGAAPSLPASRWSPRELVLWSALAIALSASWLDLARQWLAEPWARPAALFLPLLVFAGARDPRGSRSLRVGTLLVAAGLGLALVAFGGSLPRLGRPGIALALVGMALALGRPALVTALLAVWMIPPPAALLRALAPGLEQGMAWVAVEAARALGVPGSLERSSVVLAGAALDLEPADGGLPLAFYLAGIGWWGAARARRGLLRAAVSALRLVPLGFAAQALGLGVAFGLLASAGAAAARAVLDGWAWPVLALALVRARPRPSAAPVP
jgi:hypothetical protein